MKTEIECLRGQVAAIEHSLKLSPRSETVKANLALMRGLLAAAEGRKPEKAASRAVERHIIAEATVEANAAPLPQSVDRNDLADLREFGGCALLRWLGKAGRSVEDGRRAMMALGLPMNPTTVKIQVKAGANGERGLPAQLSKGQGRKLLSLCK